MLLVSSMGCRPEKSDPGSGTFLQVQSRAVSNPELYACAPWEQVLPFNFENGGWWADVAWGQEDGLTMNSFFNEAREEKGRGLFARDIQIYPLKKISSWEWESGEKWARKGLRVGLRFRGKLQLAPRDRPGYFQLAMIQRGSASFHVREKNGRIEGVENQKLTENMSCAGRPIHLDYNDQLEVEYRMALNLDQPQLKLLLWRPSTHSAEELDPSCGLSSENQFFTDSEDVPDPQMKYLDLIGRGWQPIRPENLVLPESIRRNPCR